ncbi:MAG: NifB/NifX family molybdenum-iron cluster-binding protein [Bacteroidales bacterium]|jgi:predicted Fe-Mo cluster-binding NifX family protein|nr:NifB/NifX family molybdenum-iron cluster-binding protein [Bacteroidales bacterium]
MMTQKIAIPMENGKLSAHFGHCQYFAVIAVQDKKIVEITQHMPPEHRPGVYPRWVAALGVTDVIAGGIGQRAIDLFNEQGINVFAGAPIKSEEEIVNEFLAGKLSLSANYCNHDGDHHSHC